MLGFLYSIFLKLLYPTSLSLILLVGAAVLQKRKVLSRVCFWLGIGILVICGNGWVVGALEKHLEWQNLPRGPLPQADCILVLSGGILSRVPRAANGGGGGCRRPALVWGLSASAAQGAEDRLHGGFRYRRRRCSAGFGGHGRTSQDSRRGGLRDHHRDQSHDTHEHAKNLGPMFKEKGFKRVLLVTSAMHMPRALGVFRHLCPGVEFIPAPTDFQVTKPIPAPWYHQLVAVIPTPRHLLDFSEVMHEYLGMAYYRLRGWM